MEELGTSQPNPAKSKPSSKAKSRRPSSLKCTLLSFDGSKYAIRTALFSEELNEFESEASAARVAADEPRRPPMLLDIKDLIRNKTKQQIIEDAVAASPKVAHYLQEV